MFNVPVHKPCTNLTNSVCSMYRYTNHAQTLPIVFDQCTGTQTLPIVFDQCTGTQTLPIVFDQCTGAHHDNI